MVTKYINFWLFKRQVFRKERKSFGLYAVPNTVNMVTFEGMAIDFDAFYGAQLCLYHDAYFGKEGTQQK